MTARTIFQDNHSSLLYYPDFFDSSLFAFLQKSLSWKQNRIRMFGKWHDEPRLTAWYGLPYRYSGIQWPEVAPPKELLEIMNTLQVKFGFEFNSVLLNFYRDGNDSMGWHRDNEKELDDRIIASASFGGSRLFKVKHRETKQIHQIVLEDRSLLVMQNMQQDWLHCIPKSKKYMDPRINLTFRKILEVGSS